MGEARVAIVGSGFGGLAAGIRLQAAGVRTADAGLPALPVRCAIGIRAARLIYAEIGRVIAGRQFDTQAGRAVVSRGRKAWLALRALFGTLWARGVGVVLGRRANLGRAPDPRPLPFPLLIEPERP